MGSSLAERTMVSTSYSGTISIACARRGRSPAAAGVARIASAATIIRYFTASLHHHCTAKSIGNDLGAAWAALSRLCGKLYESVNLVHIGSKRGHEPNQLIVW